MSEKKKLALVVGQVSNSVLIRQCEALQETFDVTCFAIENKRLLRSYRSSVPLVVFENLQDMTGYMRGLDEKIQDFDLVVALEASKLATFQALRTCMKMKVPCAVIVNETRPFQYEDYPNIRAIQSDIFGNAAEFWASSTSAVSMLKAEGVDSERISYVPPSFESQSFTHSESGRGRFREYVGLDPDDIVILHPGKMDKENRPLLLLGALKYIKASNPILARKIKVLMIGQGAQSRELKYFCVDNRLSDNVLFLHQETDMFERDLYSAGDLVVSFSQDRSGENPEVYPIESLQAAACGCVPVFSSDSVLADFASNVGVRILEHSPEMVARSILGIIESPTQLKRMRDKIISGEIMENATPGSSTMADRAEELIEKSMSDHQNDRDDLSDLEGLLKAKKHVDLLVEVESRLLLTEKDTIRAELFYYQGEAYRNTNELDKSMNAYSECLKISEGNSRVFRGLGFLALKGHSNEDARTFFKKSISSDASDTDSLLGMALVHHRMGLVFEAINWLERCLEANPKNVRARALLVQLCRECNDPKISIAMLEKALDRDQDEPGYLLALGELHLQHGDCSLGNDLVQKALDIQKNVA